MSSISARSTDKKMPYIFFVGHFSPSVTARGLTFAPKFVCYNLKNVFASEVTSCILKDMNEVKQSMYRLISSAVRPNILHDLNIHINTEDDCSTRTKVDQ